MKKDAAHLDSVLDASIDAYLDLADLFLQIVRKTDFNADADELRARQELSNGAIVTVTIRLPNAAPPKAKPSKDVH